MWLALLLTALEHTRARAHRRDEAFPACEVQELARQALTALEYTHRRGLIHTDVKPDNMLVQRRGGGSGDGGALLL